MSLLLLLSLGTLIGVFSGLLGIGGGLLIIPALLYLPAVLPLPVLGLKQITGIAVTQSLAGSLSASWIHRKNGNLQPSLVLMLGVASMAGSYLGGYSSRFFADSWIKGTLLGVLGLMLVFSLRSPKASGEQAEFSLEKLQKHRGTLWLVASLIGYISGVLGIGGAAFMVPILYALMHIPVRIAIGSGAGIVLLTSVMAFLGKWQGGLIPMPEALVITVGALVGANLGAKLSPKTPISILKGLMFGIILLSFLRTLLELL